MSHSEPQSQSGAPNRRVEQLRQDDIQCQTQTLPSNTDTPLRMNTSSKTHSSHTHAEVEPFVRSDLENHTLEVSVDLWSKAVLDLTPDTRKKWISYMKNDKSVGWFDDPIINSALRQYCDATLETDRYEPFCKMANRVLELAKINIPDVSSGYPLEDVTWIRNDPTVLQRHEAHGKLAASRKPDMIFLRTRDFLAEVMGPRGQPLRYWTSLLVFGEVKNTEGDGKKLLCPRLSKPAQSGSGSGSAARATSEPPTIRSTGPSTGAATLTSALSAAQTSDSSSGRKRVRGSTDLDENQPPSKKQSTGSGSRVSAPSDARYQAASYALEVLSDTNGTRSHAIGIILWGHKLSLWYYDAAGIVNSGTSYSIVEDFEEVAAILIALARCDPVRFGAMPTFRPPKDQPYPESFPPTTLAGYTLVLPSPYRTSLENADEGPVTVTLHDPIFAQYTLVGRHTVVYNATADKLGSKLVIVKISQQVATRLSEQELLNTARDAGVKNIPELHFADDLWSLEEGARRHFVGSAVNKRYESRILRALVYNRYIPLQTLFKDSSKYLSRMVYQMLDCLCDLRFKARILHRDISVNNIMFEMRDNEPYFILNDFDLATYVTEDGLPQNAASSNHRTGTLPFMSLSLLGPMGAMMDPSDSGTPLFVPRVVPAHCLRFDLESLLYVGLWCTFAMEPVKDKATRALVAAQIEHWEVGKFYDLGLRKKDLWLSVQCRRCLPFTPLFRRWRNWFEAWFIIYDQLKIVRIREQPSGNDQWNGDNLFKVEEEIFPPESPDTLHKIKDMLQQRESYMRESARKNGSSEWDDMYE